MILWKEWENFKDNGENWKVQPYNHSVVLEFADPPFKTTSTAIAISFYS